MENGRAAGVEVLREGALQHVRAPLVVLAGGGIGSPRLLQAPGCARAGAFFSDPVVAVMGSVDDLTAAPPKCRWRPACASIRRIALADLTLPRPMFQAFALQAGRVDRLGAHRHTLSIMVKIRDDIGGAVGPRWADKRLSAAIGAPATGDRDGAREIAGGRAPRVRDPPFRGASGRQRAHWRRCRQRFARRRRIIRMRCVGDSGAWGLPPTLTLLCLGIASGSIGGVRQTKNVAKTRWYGIISY